MGCKNFPIRLWHLKKHAANLLKIRPTGNKNCSHVKISNTGIKPFLLTPPVGPFTPTNQVPTPWDHRHKLLGHYHLPLQARRPLFHCSNSTPQCDPRAEYCLTSLLHFVAVKTFIIFLHMNSFYDRLVQFFINLLHGFYKLHSLIAYILQPIN